MSIKNEEKTLDKYLNPEQKAILIKHDLLHLVAQAMKAYKDTNKLKVDLFIQKLQSENDARYLTIKSNEHSSGHRRVLIHKHNYTGEIIQQLKNLKADNQRR
tara:strand:- start:27145 stop:27450 length:306 start_codon:yes stop_codon:yes gene_type:complete